MNCRDTRELVHAYADDELDAVHVRDIDAHLELCERCRNVLVGVRATRTAAANPALYHKAPPQLLSSILAATRAIEDETLLRVPLTPALSPSTSLRAGREERGQARAPRFVWGVGVGAIAAAVLMAFGLLTYFHNQRENAVVAEVFTAHLRSLQPGHLIDVASTDQHTVKPWLAGRVDFSPPVRAMDSAGSHLAGGRLDYLQGRAVAVLVYQRGNHTINLFVWPAAEGGQGSAERDGFNAVHWASAGMSFWAVSDLNQPELERFAQLYRTDPPAATTMPK